MYRQKTAHIILSFCLAFLILFGGTAKEFIHGFAGHTDTIHHPSNAKLSFDSKHHHCSFLSDSLPPFEAPTPFFIPFAKSGSFTISAVEIREAYITKELIIPAFRGPPCVSYNL